MATTKKLRIGLVGCGRFGESHLATFTGISQAEVVAVTDINQERAQNLASRYGVTKVTRNFLELCEIPEVEAVSVVTNEDQHLEPVLAALEYGKHVLVENPMQTRVEAAA